MVFHEGHEGHEDGLWFLGEMGYAERQGGATLEFKKQVAPKRAIQHSPKSRKVRAPAKYQGGIDGFRQ